MEFGTLKNGNGNPENDAHFISHPNLERKTRGCCPRYGHTVYNSLMLLFDREVYGFLGVIGSCCVQ